MLGERGVQGRRTRLGRTDQQEVGEPPAAQRLRGCLECPHHASHCIWESIDLVFYPDRLSRVVVLSCDASIRATM